MQARCTTCHSATPTHESFGTAPLGFRLDTTEQIKTGAEKILQRTVHNRDMPMNNVTGMTEAERRALGDWLTASQTASK